MKYKPLDKVRIKSIDWYNENKNKQGNISFPYEVEVVFTPEKSSYCGQIVTISKTGYIQGIGFYRIREDKGTYRWTDEMIEGLAEEESTILTDASITDGPSAVTCNSPSMNNSMSYNEIILPNGYIFKDENGNVINATKIVLEKKKKEYPKTYEECCEVMNYCCNPVATKTTHKEELIRKFQFLLLYRDAYWKIAGEEMGLGKPWEPDWLDDNLKPCIGTASNEIIKCTGYRDNAILAFPTEEMRDAFYEHFKELIEFIKELL